eukprot:TRINITY_DN66137_c6_g3_i2.p1 TRINITY_DN66137_c6_g3~~TRINITY_DN66137_c6_g3_i2.p1  ORF type:complete len:468 (+),score=154.10 TRINITY_DN66137_c6_g3_i2:7-1410(+)
MVMDFQLLSDLHLEFDSNFGAFRVPQLSDTLVLAGDICTVKHTDRLERFLAEECAGFRLVILIAGNHELYASSYKKTLAWLRGVADRFENVRFMEREHVVVADKFRFVCATLWADIPESAVSMVERCMNDYAMIEADPPSSSDDDEVEESKQNEEKPIVRRRLRVADTRRFFYRDRAWIEEQIRVAKKLDQYVVVVTHHAPLSKGTSKKVHEGSILNSAFATDMHELFGGRVLAWVFGHTHFNCDELVHGTRVVSNQMGYRMVNEHKENGFVLDKVIHIDPRPLERFWTAVEQGDVDTVKAVLVDEHRLLDARDEQWCETALHRACYAGDTKLVRFLLAAGADPAATSPRFGTTAIHSAAASGSWKCIKIVLDHVAKSASAAVVADDGVSSTSGDDEDENKEATASGAAVATLVDHQSSNGMTALHSAAHRGHKKAFKLLTKQYRADPSIRDHSGRSAADVMAKHSS